MSKTHTPSNEQLKMAFVTINVDETCVVTISRPTSNPEKPLRREWLCKAGETFRLSVSPSQPLSVSILPFEDLPESLIVDPEND